MASILNRGGKTGLSARSGAVHSAATVGQNSAWNNNYMLVPLHAGDNTLRLSLEASPGQSVYDGPNLDRIEVTSAEDQYVPPSAVPHKTGAFEHPGIWLTSENLDALKKAKDIPGSTWAKG